MYNVFTLLGTPDADTWRGWTPTDTGGIAPNGDVYHGPLLPKKDLSAVLPMLSPAAVDLLSRLLALDPTARITAAEALAHPFFAPAAADMPEPEPPGGSGVAASASSGDGDDAPAKPGAVPEVAKLSASMRHSPHADEPTTT